MMNTVPWFRPVNPALPGRQSSEWATNLALWVLATLIAVFFATLLKESAVFDGQYLPRTNDSLYHARRILDTAVGERGFYQFDERLHVPEGSWIPWPWAYDYLIAQVLRFALWISPTLDPMAFISYIAVVWLGVNSALFLACLNVSGLSGGLRAVGMLAFALSPLIQLSHATAMIDHHFMELTFVLLSVWLGMRWLSEQHDVRAAVLLGLALGIAPAFHNGLFILQVPLLGGLFVLWLKGQPIPMRSAQAFAGTLFAATLVVALPSEPLRAGMFDFYLLSWFHVYIAACTGIALIFLAWRPFSRRSLVLLGALAAVLAIPVAAQALRGAMFFSGDIRDLDEILEVHSPFKMFFQTVGPVETASYYGWLIVAAPAFVAYFAWRALRDDSRPAVFYSVWGVFGLSMLLLQYRFYYFGLVFLVSAPLLVLDATVRARNFKPGLALVGALAALLLLYQPVLRERLFTIYAAGGDRDYMGGLAAYEDLAGLCREKPGTVLANSNDGNAILYHTECSVIANNFIMTPQDERKLGEIETLMRGSPEAIRLHEPPIDYVFLRARDFSHPIDGELVLDDRNLVARAFLISDDPPPGFERTKNMLYKIGEPPKLRLYARVFRVTSHAPNPETAPAPSSQ